MNVSSKMKVSMYMRLLEGMESHFRRADNRDVKDALDVMSARRSMGHKWWVKPNGKRDTDTMVSFGIPNSWAFSPHMSRLGLETMDLNERKCFETAYRKVFNKLST